LNEVFLFQNHSEFHFYIYAFFSFFSFFTSSELAVEIKNSYSGKSFCFPYFNYYIKEPSVFPSIQNLILPFFFIQRKQEKRRDGSQRKKACHYDNLKVFLFEMLF